MYNKTLQRNLNEHISCKQMHLYEIQNIDYVMAQGIQYADIESIQSEVPLSCMAQSCTHAASLDSAPEQEPRSLAFGWNDPLHTCTQCYSHRGPVNTF